MTSQIRDTNNVSFTTYENRKNTLWNGINLYYSFVVPKLNMEVGLSAGANNYQFYTELNNELYKNSRFTMSPGIDVSFEFDDLELNLEYEPNYSSFRPLALFRQIRVTGLTILSPMWFTTLRTESKCLVSLMYSILKANKSDKSN